MFDCIGSCCPLAFRKKAPVMTCMKLSLSHQVFNGVDGCVVQLSLVTLISWVSVFLKCLGIFKIFFWYFVFKGMSQSVHLAFVYRSLPF